MRTGTAEQRRGVGSLALLVAVAICLGWASGPTRVATAGLVSQWAFDEGSGTTAGDPVGGNDGDLRPGGNPPVWVTDPAPVPSGSTYSLQFDGSNDRVIAAGYKGILGTNARSVSAWIKTTDATNNAIVSWGTSPGAGRRWSFRTQSSNPPVGTIRVDVAGGAQIGNTFVADGNWHHVASTWEDDGSPNVRDVRLWVDGVLQGISSPAGEPINTMAGSEDFRIGRNVGSTQYFNGQIDEVRLYDHALDRNEVRALANLAPDAYWSAVQADGPIAYWRLGETSGSKAFNEGTLGSATDGSYNGSPLQGQPGLLPATTNGATRFQGNAAGNNDRVTVPEHVEINSGGPYTQKTVEAWFMTDAYIGNQDIRVIYEQGNTTDGMNLHTTRSGPDDDEYGLRYRVFHNNGTQRNHTRQVEIEPGQVYHAVMTYDDASNRFLNYLNGAPVGFRGGSNIESIPAHGGDATIGEKRNGTRFGSASSGSGNRFQGVIDEVALYNSIVDLRSIQTHYVAGVGTPRALGLRRGTTLGVMLNYDASFDADADTTWQETIGSRPNASGVDQFHWDLGAPGDIPRVSVSGPLLSVLTHAYEFDGTDTAFLDEPGSAGRSMSEVAGNPDLFSATFELVFRPDDFTGQEVIFETGGGTDGVAMWLDGSVLRFDVKDSARSARSTFDLGDLSPEEQADFLHAIGVADLDNDRAVLYVNGLLRDTAAATGGDQDLTDWAGSNEAGLGGINDGIAFGAGGRTSFDGQIALVRAYPSALGADEVLSNYRALIPEPATPLLLAAGALALARRRRARH